MACDEVKADVRSAITPAISPAFTPSISTHMSLHLSSLPPRLDSIDCPLLRQHDVVLNVLRLDLMHPHLHGNKWFKLQPNVEYALAQQMPTILSFGGAYSNHLYALAAAGKQFGLRTIGMVRGELVQPLNPVLGFAQQQGMELVAVSRTEYRRKSEPEFIEQLRQRFGAFHLVPEGGGNELGVTGCTQIVRLLEWQSTERPRYIGLACGTGTTLAGVVIGLHATRSQPLPTVLGVGVVNAPGYLRQEVARRLPLACAPTWSMLEDYHGGGYGKTSPALQAFLTEFSRYSTIPLEPVYTGKLLQGLFDQIRQGLIPAGAEVLALHSGGIY